MSSSQETLGLILVREGVINRSQLYDALRLQRQNGRLLGTCLLSLGYLGADRLLAFLSEQLRVPVLPPGSLRFAATEAVSMVPGGLALSLRILPYSFDGRMLGVAVADGRVLEQLHEVAKVTRTAVGAYVALEMEIEAALAKLYGEQALEAHRDQSPELPGRARPMRVELLEEVPTRDFGAALGLDDPSTPVVLDRPKTVAIPMDGPGGTNASRGPQPGPPAPAAPQLAPSDAGTPAQQGALAADNLGLPAYNPTELLPPGIPPPAAPPPADKPKRPPTSSVPRKGPPRLGPPLTRLGLYQAVEEIYAAPDTEEVGRLVGRALLDYFKRVMVLVVQERQLEVVGYGGLKPGRAAIAMEAIPEVAAGLGQRHISYGRAADDPRASELCDMFDLEEGVTSLLAPVRWAQDEQAELLVWADNADDPEMYDDLHDVELLLKEAETALGMMME